MNSRVSMFIRALADAEVGESAFNQYLHPTRRSNLHLYLTDMLSRKPSTLLVGEAPGYQGSRLTGVPFMSEHILLNGIESIGMFGAHRGYVKTDEYPDRIWKEPSATIVWGALGNIPDPRQLPLIWAAFPFHPHAGDPHTNRAPTSQELEIGRPFLHDLIDIFGIKNLIAVGNQAHKTLGIMGYDVPKVRHPSHGGKNDFIKGLHDHALRG